MRVFVFGRHEILYETVQAIRDDVEIGAIVTAPARPEYLRTESDFAALARELECPFVVTRNINGPEIRELATSTEADVAISVNWINIVGPEFCSLFPGGVINAHAGDLPRFRGNAVTNWAMLLGEDHVVLTLHFMDPGALDAGDVLARERLPIGPETTIADVNTRIVEAAPRLFRKTLREMESDTLVPVPQSQLGGRAFRCYPRLPEYSRIDWADSAAQIDRLIRASTRPYSGAFTFLRDADDAVRKLTLWKARIVADAVEDVGVPGHIVRNDPDSGESWILTGAGVLAAQEVQIGDGEPFAPGNVWRSIRRSLGIDPGTEILRLQRHVDALAARVSQIEGGNR